MASAGFSWDDRALVASIATIDAKADAAISAAMAYHATRAVAWARQNAPWTDRTSNARNGLFTRAERDLPFYRIIIAHSVPYGIWLEVRWNGKYQIIRPTIDHEGPEVMQTVSRLFGAMFGGP